VVNAAGERFPDGSTIGISSDSGFSATFGALVGHVAAGDFFAIGRAGFAGAANADGKLRLHDRGHTTSDAGSISVNVTASAVPLPAGLPLLPSGKRAFALASRRGKT
jgi:hypothetical protein